MYTYQNKKTGRVVKTTCRVIGNNWELVASAPPKEEYPVKQPKSRKRKKASKPGGDNG